MVGDFLLLLKIFRNHYTPNRIDKPKYLKVQFYQNLLNQPAVKLYNLNKNAKKFKNAQEIEDRGFFIALHPKRIQETTLNYLTKKLLQVGNVF